MSDATQFTFAYLVLFFIARSIESISHVNLPPPLFFKRAMNLEYHTHLPPCENQSIYGLFYRCSQIPSAEGHMTQY